MSVRPGSYGCAVARQARNGPCPCGSGRKYKRCCLGEEERLARDAGLETDVGRAIADWSAAVYADELADAFEEFHPESRRVDEGAFAQFLTWFNSDRELSAGGTPVERYAARPDVDPVEREVAERIAAARLGLHRVRSVAPGQSIELENVLTGTSIRVASQSISRELVRWDVVLCRVMPGEPLPSLWGPVLTYEPGEEPELLAELERLADEHGLPLDPAGLSEACRVGSRELLRFTPPSRLVEPSLFTVEGDPIVHARAVWRLGDPEAAFGALDAPPELLWVGESEDGTGETFQLTGDRGALLARRRPLPPGALYFESSYDGYPDRLGLGTFVLAGDELRYDAISEARLERALTLVAQRLAGAARLIEREIVPFEHDGPRRASADVPDEADPLAADFLAGYLRRWLDEPLERLEGLTPRRAAGIPKLRAELELLLRAIENRAARARREGSAWPDVGWLWEELGFTSQLAA